MRIVIEALSARHGGGQTYLRHFLAHDPPSFVERVDVLAPPSLSLPKLGRGIQRLPVSPVLENPFARAAWLRVELPRLLVKLGANAVYFPGGLTTRNLPASCRSVVMFQNMLPFAPDCIRQIPVGYQKTRLSMLRPLFVRSMNRADLVLFISAFAQNSVRQFGVHPKKEEVVIHGVDPAFRNAPSLPLSPRIPPGEYLLYVSILERYKHQREVVEAYAELRRLRTTHEKLVLVGTSRDAYGPEVRRCIQELGLRGEVVLTGELPHHSLPQVYANAKAVLFASEVENCPFILLESMASGRPVFSSNRASMPEFGGDALRYFDPRQPSELAHRLAESLDNPAGLLDMARAAQQRSMLFEWSDTASKTWNAIASVCG